MPPVELVRPGLWSIPVPIPRNPLRYLLAYALEVDGGVALLAACGVPDDEGAELTIASMGIRPLVELVQPDVLIEDGARVDLAGVELQAIWTPGHSPGYLCFWEGRRRLLLSGDHVLPRISPNISIHSQQRPDPLADFLESLMKVRGLDAEEVLPAHEWRFRNLAARVDEL